MYDKIKHYIAEGLIFVPCWKLPSNYNFVRGAIVTAPSLKSVLTDTTFSFEKVNYFIDTNFYLTYGKMYSTKGLADSAIEAWLDELTWLSIVSPLPSEFLPPPTGLFYDTKEEYERQDPFDNGADFTPCDY